MIRLQLQQMMVQQTASPQGHTSMAFKAGRQPQQLGQLVLVQTVPVCKAVLGLWLHQVLMQAALPLSLPAALGRSTLKKNASHRMLKKDAGRSMLKKSPGCRTLDKRASRHSLLQQKLLWLLAPPPGCCTASAA